MLGDLALSRCSSSSQRRKSLMASVTPDIDVICVYFIWTMTSDPWVFAFTPGIKMRLFSLCQHCDRISICTLVTRCIPGQEKMSLTDIVQSLWLLVAFAGHLKLAGRFDLMNVVTLYTWYLNLLRSDHSVSPTISRCGLVDPTAFQSQCVLLAFTLALTYMSFLIQLTHPDFSAFQWPTDESGFCTG